MRLAHAAEIDGEAGHVATVAVGDDEGGPGAAVEVANRKAVQAAREIAAVLLLDGRALVLHEGGLDLEVAHDEPGHVEPREALRVSVQLRPHDEPLASLLEDLVGLARPE